MNHFDPAPLYHPNFDLGEFRYAASRYVKLLIRARWRCEPAFLAEAELAGWSLPNIANDPLSAGKLLDQAASALENLHMQGFLLPCSSGGIAVVDETTLMGRLVTNVTSLADFGQDGFPHNHILLQAARRLHDGSGMNWAALIDWDLLPVIRADLDQLPHPKPRVVSPQEETDEESEIKPRWDKGSQTLFFGRQVARAIDVARGKTIVPVLDSFAELNWPRSIDSPFTARSYKVKEAVYQLNTGLLWFRFGRSGDAIHWDPA
jgi:hypothetical protein